MHIEDLAELLVREPAEKSHSLASFGPSWSVAGMPVSLRRGLKLRGESKTLEHTA